MNKGYIVPIILIAVLIVLAGLVLFGPFTQTATPNVQPEPINQNTVEPVIETQLNQEEELPPIILNQDNQTPPVDTGVETGTSVSETSTNTPTQVCRDTAECSSGQTCFIRPDGDTGYCF
jgi:hypothetical protein